MFSVSLSDVTATQTAGKSHRMARTSSIPASAVRRHLAGRARGRDTAAGAVTMPTISVLRVSPEEPELERREAEDDRAEHPGHCRRGPEVEEVPERRLVEVLDHGARRVARSAVGQDVDLPEDL